MVHVYSYIHVGAEINTPKQNFFVVTAHSHPSTTHIPHREIGRFV